MKPIKLFAFLVTLQLTSGLTLKAADLPNFRNWTDDKGRQINARLVESPNAESVKIERQDGRVFTVPLKTFSNVDQAYVQAYRAMQPGGALSGVLTEADVATWNLLNSTGPQPGLVYTNTDLEKIVADLNERLTAKGVKTPTGLLVQLRTEPSDLGTQIKLSGELPTMSTSSFLKKIAGINNLDVKTDPAGMVVLVDKTAPASPPSKPPVATNVFGTTESP